jgi:hypothetical protein
MITSYRPETHKNMKPQITHRGLRPQPKKLGSLEAGKLGSWEAGKLGKNTKIVWVLAHVVKIMVRKKIAENLHHTIDTTVTEIKCCNKSKKLNNCSTDYTD